MLSKLVLSNVEFNFWYRDTPKTNHKCPGQLKVPVQMFICMFLIVFLKLLTLRGDGKLPYVSKCELMLANMVLQLTRDIISIHLKM